MSKPLPPEPPLPPMLTDAEAARVVLPPIEAPKAPASSGRIDRAVSKYLMEMGAKPIYGGTERHWSCGCVVDDRGGGREDVRPCDRHRLALRGW